MNNEVSVHTKPRGIKKKHLHCLIVYNPPTSSIFFYKKALLQLNEIFYISYVKIKKKKKRYKELVVVLNQTAFAHWEYFKEKEKVGKKKSTQQK